MKDSPELHTRLVDNSTVHYFPTKRSPRWVVRHGFEGVFWRILPANGLRGLARRGFARWIFPRFSRGVIESAHELGGYEFLYLGVPDGKRTELKMKFEGDSVLIEKYAVEVAAEKYLKNEAATLERLQAANSANFPWLISHGYGSLKLRGRLPKRGFDPRKRKDRYNLIKALTSMYSILGIQTNAEGCCKVIGHGDLNKWNMFIDMADDVHIFDFENATLQLLGYDLVTAYRMELTKARLHDALKEGLLAFSKHPSFQFLDVQRQFEMLLRTE
ncbi:phosphotransferase [Sphingomicrobium astaxanthinifaciens]|uniref:phosphotransferase n=1 Tax=Sphingomicrobium astaxanthinifaciens TaxID=1227949 RepID=UPI001FCC52E1|nr:phosphotransferase [Sphingomicrobium astaxanthinifaciens]MCJ7420413.1 aminoglycoside phosphotransferase family protein [Sphingomicrobium astaxanthinifaciens]